MVGSKYVMHVYIHITATNVLILDVFLPILELIS